MDEPSSIERAAIAALREQHIGRLLLNAQRNYSLQALTMLRQRGHAGLTLAHTNLLAHLDLAGTRITALAERMGVTKQAIGSLVGELEERGYIHRATDPDDRRAAIITYTATGWGFLHDAHEVKLEIEAEYSAVLGEQGMHDLRRLLARLVHSRSGE